MGKLAEQIVTVNAKAKNLFIMLSFFSHFDNLL